MLPYLLRRSAFLVVSFLVAMTVLFVLLRVQRRTPSSR